MIETDSKQIKQYESDLKTFRAKAYPFATKATVNRGAWNTRKVAKDFIKGRFITRNAWTLQSVKVVQAKTLDVRQQEARTGSTEQYMERQEFGATLRSSGTHGRPIAMPHASGESGLPRRRLPRKSNKLQNIQLKRGRAISTNRRQRNRVAVLQAAQGKGPRFVFLDLGRRSGIYRVTGRAKRPTLKKVWDLSRKTVTLQPKPWLLPATEKVRPYMGRYYSDALLHQLKRHGVLGY